MKAKEYIIKDCKDPETGKCPTWDEIEKHISYDIYGTERLMEEYAQHNLREELINYDKWMVEVKWGTDVPSAEKSVDEYLKSKHTKNDTKDNIKNLLREYGFYGINHNEDANNKLIEALINLFNRL